MRYGRLPTLFIAGLIVLLAVGSVFGQSLSTRASWRNGNLSYRDTGYSQQEGVSIWELCPQLVLLDPSVGFTVYHEFADGDSLTGQWSFSSNDGSSVFAMIDSTSGWARAISHSDSGDYCDYRSTQESFKLATGKPLWYEARISTTDATQSAWVVGLMNATTGLHSTTVATDGVYFKKDDGDANIDVVQVKNSTTTLSTGDSGSDAADSTMVRLGIVYDGASTVSYYVDGVLKKSYTANLPSDEFMKPVFQVMAGSGAEDTLYVDYLKAVQIR